jgi:hypothetical protein
MHLGPYVGNEQIALGNIHSLQQMSLNIDTWVTEYEYMMIVLQKYNVEENHDENAK